MTNDELLVSSGTACTAEEVIKKQDFPEIFKIDLLKKIKVELSS